jgi:hypothetical protein
MKLNGESENLAVLKHLQCFKIEETEKMERKTKNFSLHFFKFLKKLSFNYFTIRGGSLKKIAKKIIPNVPINKKV